MTTTLLMDTIGQYLDRLRLPKAKEILLEVKQLAETQSIGYLDFLERLLSEEVASKEQRRIEFSLKLSGLPYTRTLDDFDFKAAPELDQRQIRSLFDLSFLRDNMNVLFLGPPGLGKTHLAVSLAVKACHEGHSIYFTEMDSLIAKLKSDAAENRPRRGRSYNKSALVVIDEVGYTPLDRHECNLFFRFIKSRYEKGSTIITSNKSFSDWAELAHDPVIITAVLDRLLHHSIVINVKGNSYRLKGKSLKSKEVVQTI